MNAAPLPLCQVPGANNVTQERHLSTAGERMNAVTGALAGAGQVAVLRSVTMPAPLSPMARNGNLGVPAETGTRQIWNIQVLYIPWP